MDFDTVLQAVKDYIDTHPRTDANQALALDILLGDLSTAYYEDVLDQQPAPEPITSPVYLAIDDSPADDDIPY